MITMHLILASSSRYRRSLLERLIRNFRCISPAIDESPQADERPVALVYRLALQKAQAIARTESPALVIASDQAVVAAGELLGKPGDKDTAIAQLQQQSGEKVMVYTSVCVLNASTRQVEVDVVPVEVRFRDLSLAEIERYVDKERPWDCAGSFKSEGYGITLFQSVLTEDSTALVGLPLIKTAELLRAQGLNLP